MKRNFGAWMAAVGLLAACAPALDWREVRPEDSGITMLFPCKPDSHARRVSLATQQLRLVLHACTAGTSTWALAVADIGDPALVGEALIELAVAAQRNLEASQARPLGLKVDGATPNPHSRRFEITGRVPGGREVTEQVAVFNKGTRVYQATALGDRLEPEAVDTFFGNLRVSP
jgi:hypothetical protein